jgi:hypothetical protein
MQPASQLQHYTMQATTHYSTMQLASNYMHSTIQLYVHTASQPITGPCSQPADYSTKSCSYISNRIIFFQSLFFNKHYSVSETVES